MLDHTTSLHLPTAHMPARTQQGAGSVDPPPNLSEKPAVAAASDRTQRARPRSARISCRSQSFGLPRPRSITGAGISGHRHWYVVVDVSIDQDGRRRQRWHSSFRTRREAEVVRARLVGDLDSGM